MPRQAGKRQEDIVHRGPSGRLLPAKPVTDPFSPCASRVRPCYSAYPGAEWIIHRLPPAGAPGLLPNRRL